MYDHGCGAQGGAQGFGLHGRRLLMDDWARYLDGGRPAGGHAPALTDPMRRADGDSPRRAARQALRLLRWRCAPGGRGRATPRPPAWAGPQACLRPGTERIDDDERGGGEMRATTAARCGVSATSRSATGSARGAAVAEGFEGEAQLPLASSLCVHNEYAGC